MLDAILRTQSTRHIGQFPDYIAFIAQFIAGAQKEVAILCDFPAYGSFSAHHDFLKYRQVIETKIDEGGICQDYVSGFCKSRESCPPAVLRRGANLGDLE